MSLLASYPSSRHSVCLALVFASCSRMSSRSDRTPSAFPLHRCLTCVTAPRCHRALPSRVPPTTHRRPRSGTSRMDMCTSRPGRISRKDMGMGQNPDDSVRNHIKQVSSSPSRLEQSHGYLSGLIPPSTPLRPLILPPLLLSLLSPVLGTLTSATTSDSIWPLAGGLFFVHLLLADFSTGQDARLKRRERKRREERKRRSSVSRMEPSSTDEKRHV